jgi:hypothetical protein
MGIAVAASDCKEEEWTGQVTLDTCNADGGILNAEVTLKGEGATKEETGSGKGDAAVSAARE